MHVVSRFAPPTAGMPTALPGRANAARLAVAGVALAGAALIVVGPAAQTLPVGQPAVQQREVALVDAASDFVETSWSTVVSEAEGNLSTLQTEIAAVPLHADLETLFGGFSSELSTDLQGSESALTTYLDSLPATFSTALTDLEAGQFTNAFAALDVNSLDSLEDIAKPLFDLLSTTSRTTGEVTEVGILGTLAQDAVNAFDNVFSTGGAFSLAKALLTPDITADFELANNLDAIEASFSDGDYSQALTEIENIPSGYIGALLNGFTPYVDGVQPNEAFPGLLDSGGALDYFFVTIPTDIANALGVSTTDAAASAAVDATSLVDPISFADLASSLLGSL